MEEKYRIECMSLPNDVIHINLLSSHVGMDSFQSVYRKNQ